MKILFYDVLMFAKVNPRKKIEIFYLSYFNSRIKETRDSNGFTFYSTFHYVHIVDILVQHTLPDSKKEMWKEHLMYTWITTNNYNWIFIVLQDLELNINTFNPCNYIMRRILLLFHGWANHANRVSSKSPKEIQSVNTGAGL